MRRMDFTSSLSVIIKKLKLTSVNVRSYNRVLPESKVCKCIKKASAQHYFVFILNCMVFVGVIFAQLGRGRGNLFNSC